MMMPLEAGTQTTRLTLEPAGTWALVDGTLRLGRVVVKLNDDEHGRWVRVASITFDISVPVEEGRKETEKVGTTFAKRSASLVDSAGSGSSSIIRSRFADDYSATRSGNR